MSEQREREREREREWGNQQTESRKRCNQSMGSDARIRKKRVGKGEARKVFKFIIIIINQLAGFLHMLTFVAAADIESASPPMMLFLFCFVLHVFLQSSSSSGSVTSPPPPSLPVDQEH